MTANDAIAAGFEDARNGPHIGVTMSASDGARCLSCYRPISAERDATLADLYPTLCETCAERERYIDRMADPGDRR